MPLGGENVGQAYVRIYADGSSIPGDIRDSLEDAEPGVRAQAREHGDAYDEEFRKRTSQKDMGKGIRDALDKSMARADVADSFFNSRHWKQFQRRVEREFGESGRLAATSLENEFRKRGDLTGLQAEMERMTLHVHRATERILQAERDMLDEALDLNKKYDADRLRAHLDMLNEAHRDNVAFDRKRRELEAQRLRDHLDMLTEAHWLNKEYDRKQRAMLDRQEFEWDRHVRDQQRNVDRIRAQFDSITEALERLEMGEKAERGSRRELLRDLSSLERLMKSAGGATDEWEVSLHRVEKRLITLHPKMNRFERGMHRVADLAGTAFGRGSRNDLLNFIGSLARGLILVPTLLTRGIGKMLDFGNSLKFVFDEQMRNSGSAFRATAAVMAAGAESIALAVAGIAVAAIGLAVFVGPLIGLLSTLTGIVTALASTLAFALVGGLAAVAGALLPLIGGIGVTVTAFMALNDAQKEILKADFKPVTDALRDLGDVARRGVFSNTEEQGRRLGKVLEGLRPLISGMGEAVSDVADTWIRMFQSPAFNKFRRDMTTFLPGAIEQLGTITSNTFAGILGLLRGSLPLVQRFLDWSEDITREFRQWANSAEGQRDILDFFERAGDSAAAFGDFLGSVNDLLGSIFSAGRDTGDSMFTAMADSLDRMATWVDEHGSEMDQWFEDAQETFSALGELVRDLSAAFDALDTSTSRAMGTDLVRGLGSALLFVAKVADAGAQMLNGLITGFQTVMPYISSFVGAVVWGATETGKFLWAIGSLKWLDWLRDKLANIDWGGLWSQVVEGASRIPVRLIGSLGRVPGIISSNFNAGRLLGLVNPGFNGIVNLWNRMPDRIRGAISGVPGTVSRIFTSAANGVQNIPSKISGFFNGLPGKIGGLVDGVKSKIESPFNRAVQAVATIPGRIVAPFIGLAGRILSAIGTIDIGSLVKVPGGSLGGFVLDQIGKIGGDAAGALYGRITNGPMLRWVGEDGPEAIVPLNRPLNQVDPAVRALSAIAQGLAPGMASGGVSRGKQVDASGWTIVTQGADPALVARQVVDEFYAQTF